MGQESGDLPGDWICRIDAGALDGSCTEDLPVDESFQSGKLSVEPKGVYFDDLRRRRGMDTSSCRQIEVVVAISQTVQMKR